jgi:hypothetical protein
LSVAKLEVAIEVKVDQGRRAAIVGRTFDAMKVREWRLTSHVNDSLQLPSELRLTDLDVRVALPGGAR